MRIVLTVVLSVVMMGHLCPIGAAEVNQDNIRAVMAWLARFWGDDFEVNVRKFFAPKEPVIHLVRAERFREQCKNIPQCAGPYAIGITDGEKILIAHGAVHPLLEAGEGIIHELGHLKRPGYSLEEEAEVRLESVKFYRGALGDRWLKQTQADLKKVCVQRNHPQGGIIWTTSSDSADDPAIQLLREKLAEQRIIIPSDGIHASKLRDITLALLNKREQLEFLLARGHYPISAKR